jgi:hypothetical protein
MPFDAITRTALEYYTAHPPATEDVWYGPAHGPPSSQLSSLLLKGT